MRRGQGPLLTIGLASWLATGCGGSEAPREPARSRMTEALLEADLAQYRRQLEAQDFAGAATTGRGIVSAHPGSAAAAEVERTLADVEAKAEGAVVQRRLAELWAYQSGIESGGAQSAASIFSDAADSSGARTRLVLRRHAAWGESAYLYADGPGFTCPTPCALTLRFDGGPAETWKATAPATGEPALFIDDHATLVERLDDASRLEIEGGGSTPLLFEVGGFDPARWAPLPPS